MVGGVELVSNGCEMACCFLGFGPQTLWAQLGCGVGGRDIASRQTCEVPRAEAFFWQREKREADLLQVLARHNPQRNVASLSRVACMATDERTDSWPGRLTDVTIDPVARLCSGLFFRFVPILSYPILFITSYDSLSVQFHMSLSLAFPHSHPCHSCPPLPIPCLCSCLFSGLGMFVESWSPTQIHPAPLSSSFAG